MRAVKAAVTKAMATAKGAIHEAPEAGWLAKVKSAPVTARPRGTAPACAFQRPPAAAVNAAR
jgi:hypothetical protein